MIVKTIYNLIMIVFICHIIHISNGDICVVLNIYSVIVYDMQINMNNFYCIPNTPLHVIICVTNIHRMHDLSYNAQFDI